MLCTFCSKICKNKNSLINHERLCKLNPNKAEHPKGNKGKQGWNKGLTIDSDIRVKLNSEAVSKFRKENGSNWTGRKHSEETKQLMSIKATQRLSKNSKYSKNFEYKPGIILESSYEVNVAEILDELQIEWIKVRTGYIWDDNGKQRRYIPDFYIPKYDLFLDPKNNFLIKKDKYKIESACKLNNIKVVVISKDQITKEFFEQLFPR